MERLTAKCLKGSGYYMACSKTCPYDCMEDCDCEEFDNFVNRLGAIEDMCAEYDLDRLRELAQADREGRCVVLPDAKYTDTGGETALRRAMYICGVQNNPVTRYTADAIAEKLTREEAEAALKGGTHETNPV